MIIKNNKEHLVKNIYGEYSIPDEISYTYTAQVIMNGGVHEDTTIEYIRSVGGNIIHSGTGFGDFLPALKNCDKIWTFEPNKLMYNSSLKTISLNGLKNVEIFPYAIGDFNGKGLLKHIDKNGLEMGPRSEMGVDGVEVDMVKLDSIIPKSTKISLIHLDLEGYEFEALNGAKEIIGRDKPIIVLEIDSRAVTYNDFMMSMDYYPFKQLIYNSNEKMVFVNTVYYHISKLEVNKEYWSSELPRPLAPSDDDVEIFKKFMREGSTLLLGCTKKLIGLSEIQMDNDPWYDGDSVIKQDWVTNDVFFDNIIGDGVLNFTHELAEDIIQMCSKNCKIFVARVFNRKLPIMRIADNFPKPYDFTIPPSEVKIFDDYSFYVWRF